MDTPNSSLRRLIGVDHSPGRLDAETVSLESAARNPEDRFYECEAGGVPEYLQRCRFIPTMEQSSAADVGNMKRAENERNFDEPLPVSLDGRNTGVQGFSDLLLYSALVGQEQDPGRMFVDIGELLLHIRAQSGNRQVHADTGADRRAVKRCLEWGKA